jgi:hypothetical protein
MLKLQTLLKRIEELENQVQELTLMLHALQVQNDPIYFEKESPFKEYADFSEVRWIGKTKEETE